VTLLALVYFALAALGLLVVFAGKTPVLAKATAAVVIPVFAFAVWQAARPPTGWPATGTPSGQLVAGYVQEPDALSHTPGEIDVWAVPEGATRPRAFRLPYSRALHEQTLQAMGQVKRGVRVGVAKRVKSGQSSNRSGLRFYKLPPPQAPSKN
jgi:hypothetical protein